MQLSIGGCGYFYYIITYVFICMCTPVCMCAHVCVRVCTSPHMEVRGQPMAVSVHLEGSQTWPWTSLSPHEYVGTLCSMCSRNGRNPQSLLHPMGNTSILGGAQGIPTVISLKRPFKCHFLKGDILKAFRSEYSRVLSISPRHNCNC